MTTLIVRCNCVRKFPLCNRDIITKISRYNRNRDIKFNRDISRQHEHCRVKNYALRDVNDYGNDDPITRCHIRKMSLFNATRVATLITNS